MLEISVIIATHNRCESLKETLKSLLRLEKDGFLNYEIIIADNNSHDKTKEVVENFIPQFHGKLRYTFEPLQGKSHALNTAIQEAEGRIIAFTDDDVVVDQNWLKNIERYFNQYPDIGGLAGRLTPRLTCKKPSWLELEGNYVLKGGLNFYDHGDKVFYIENKSKPFLGANMALRKEVFERHGLFNENIPKIHNRLLIYEDTEFYRRIKEKGEKVIYAPDVVVEHIFDETRINKKYFRYWYFNAGISAALVDHPGTVRYFLNFPRWLIRETVENFLRFFLNYVKFDAVKAFYYETQFYFNLGQARGYLKKSYYENSNNKSRNFSHSSH